MYDHVVPYGICWVQYMRFQLRETSYFLIVIILSKGASMCMISTMTLPCIWAMLRHVFWTNLHVFTWSPLPTQNPCTRKTFVVFGLYLRPWHPLKLQVSILGNIENVQFSQLEWQKLWRNLGNMRLRKVFGDMINKMWY
jgi:hypothetical protein